MRWLNRAIRAGLFLSTSALVASAEELTVASAPPVVVSTEPRAGQTDVAPGTNEIRVTFSRPMRDGGWSWVKLSDTSFPKTTGNPRFFDNQRTCVLPVSLEPGKTYAMWLNRPPYENFQDQDGHKAVPYLLVFETRH
jgi:RNA polymerase sigma-70 factor (ECF subfamily)